MSLRQNKKQITGTLQLFLKEEQRLNRMNQQQHSQVNNLYVKYNTQQISKQEKYMPQQKKPISSLKTQQKQLPNHSIDILVKNRNIYLPQLPNRENKLIQPKYLINDIIYFGSSTPQGRKGRKKYSLQKEFNQKTNQDTQISKSISKSSRKISDLQMVEIQLKQYEKSHVQLQTKSKSKKTLSLSQRQKNSQNVCNTKNISQFKLQAKDNESFIRQKSKIEKLLQNFKLKKQKSNNPSADRRSNLIESINQLQRIRVIGEQTNYFQKMVYEQPKKQKMSLSKHRHFNWKAKQMPFRQLTQLQARRLLLLYLFADEVTPASSGYYKAYIGQGNNSHLIARLIKNRSSWMITEDISQANFIWTQLPQPQEMKKLKSHPQLQLSLATQKEFIPYQIEKKQKKEIQQFMKFKNNNFFNACSNIMHPTIYHKFILEFVSKFKQNAYLKNFIYIKDQVIKHYGKIDLLKRVQSKKLKIINHCEHSQQIGDKKLLLFHIQNYCLINGISKESIIPKTIHLNSNSLSELKSSMSIESILLRQLQSFLDQQQMLILKPGQQSNRGKGITIHPNKQSLIDYISKSLSLFPQNKTYVVQQYIDPLLYQGRKFDIRIWVLYSNNRLWFYREGYIRTSCKEFTTKNMNKYIHLTNDAIQKYSDQYGKYQPANKLSFHDMDKYLKKQYNYDKFYTEIYNNIKKLTKSLFEVGSLMIGRSTQQFQLFGLDFLVDKHFKVWLIECNTNPSIQICCSLLSRLVPNMLQNLFSIVLDPLFPPTQRKLIAEDKDWNSQKFNFQLLYDGTLETKYLQRIVKDGKGYLQVLRGINQFKLQGIGRQNKEQEQMQ